jgi:hypothetical protein
VAAPPSVVDTPAAASSGSNPGVAALFILAFAACGVLIFIAVRKRAAIRVRLARLGLVYGAHEDPTERRGIVVMGAEQHASAVVQQSTQSAAAVHSV